MKAYRKHVYVCTFGGNCQKRGSEPIAPTLKSILEEKGLAQEIRVTKSGCVGACGFGPNLVIWPDGVWYYGLKPEDLAQVVEEHLVGGREIERLLIHKQGETVPEVVKDPVCGMIFREYEAKARLPYNGKTYYFCDDGCKEAFQSDPQAVLQGEGGGHHH
ncbi:MAG: YHS domain-containing protein [Chloroflexi bacterium]|nr:YHS domain-containing protein [Chloroflexota bacterium]